jgi:hypothetical protein
LTGYFGGSYDIGGYPISSSVNGIVADLSRTIAGNSWNAWFLITLPEQILIPRVRMFTMDVRT